jgi:spore maturation protein CgeB
MSSVDLLVTGASGGTNVGQSLFEGARTLGLNVAFLDTRLATDGPKLWVKVSWHLLGRRPARLTRFSEMAVAECERLRPRYFLSVGMAPVKADAVHRIRRLGTTTINFLTDDPWNPTHRSRWGLHALSEYDRIASPRRANLAQLRTLGRSQVCYVPFGYDPRHCFPQPPDEGLASDVIFVGGADADRVPWIGKLVGTGARVALYGSYWDRYDETRGVGRGQVGPEIIRGATSSAKIALCLVRRANRDGHVMRSMEIPAIGACMLAEDTEEHRELFGRDGDAVCYFRTPTEMVERAEKLLASERERQRLRDVAHARITGGRHTYADRLQTMLSEASVAAT